MGHYIYRISRVKPALFPEGSAEENRVAEAHSAYLEDLTRRGVVVLAGPTTAEATERFGIVIFKAAGIEEARKIMNEDPFVSGGVMEGELHPYRISFFNATARQL